MAVLAADLATHAGGLEGHGPNHVGHDPASPAPHAAARSTPALRQPDLVGLGVLSTHQRHTLPGFRRPEAASRVRTASAEAGPAAAGTHR